jgi:2-polyprenyl-3-methyl-5-hydroxy-6-metoxy-1,4-benzoquinol methylase
MEYGPGAGYAARLAELAATGMDMHGEARFCAELVAPGARVLDAGCGTGRVAARLAELGFDCVGVDVDQSMLDFAPTTPGVRWIRADLAELDLPALGVAADFDLVVAAGNVIPFVEQGAVGEVLRRLARHLRPAGILVAGFGLDRAHLPGLAAFIELADYDRWCVEVGLELLTRCATWNGDPYAGGGYAVSVHRLA